LQGEIEAEILEEEGLSRDDFQRAKALKVNIFGGLRVALEKVIDLGTRIVSEKKGSSVNSLEFKFILHKGAYATILLREFMKPKTDEQLVKSGF
ncbi:MAG: tRNA pseudouridine(13) synthase TruD, partial [Candidatus Bathyarchaeia archaeon]